MADLDRTMPPAIPESGYDRLLAVLGLLGEVIIPDPIAVIPPAFPVAEPFWTLYCTVFCAGRRVDCFARAIDPEADAQGEDAPAPQRQHQISLVSSPAGDEPFDMELFLEWTKTTPTPKIVQRPLRRGEGVLYKVAGLQILELNSPPARPQVLGDKLLLNTAARSYVWCPNTCGLDCYPSRRDLASVICCADIAAWPGSASFWKQRPPTELAPSPCSTAMLEPEISSGATAVSVETRGENLFLARFAFQSGALRYGPLHSVKLESPPLCLAPLVNGAFLAVFRERLAILDSDFKEIYSHAPADFDFAEGLTWAVETIPAHSTRGPGATKHFPNYLALSGGDADERSWAEDDHIHLQLSAEGWTMVIEIRHRDSAYLRYLKRKEALALAP